VMGNPKWRPGILGLVANKLMEAHDKPVFLWGREGGDVLRGSCRSNTVSVVELMAAAGDVFDHFGGHRASGGFAVAEERAHELPARLAAAYAVLSASAPLSQEILLDREMSLGEMQNAHRELRRLSPFGVGNTKPLFIFPNVSVVGARVFGKQQNHLELSLEREGTRTAGISFFATPDSFSKKVQPGDKADVVGHVEADWRGNPRLRVVDIL
jgi:single-stranded-DNA-specific exonuclease